MPTRSAVERATLALLAEADVANEQALRRRKIEHFTIFLNGALRRHKPPSYFLQTHIDAVLVNYPDGVPTTLATPPRPLTTYGGYYSFAERVLPVPGRDDEHFLGIDLSYHARSTSGPPDLGSDATVLGGVRPDDQAKPELWTPAGPVKDLEELGKLIVITDGVLKALTTDAYPGFREEE